MGPGTGHGQGFLVKSRFSPCYEVNPSEGGHTEFAPRNEEDFKLTQFAIDYIQNSNNVENLRGKGPLDRVSHERLGAGPALPLIYEFMKTQMPDAERVLETGENAKTPDQIDSHDIISTANKGTDKLCKATMKKFGEIFAVQTGDTALKFLPYGGIYLIGGVTMGMRDYIMHDRSWLDTVH